MEVSNTELLIQWKRVNEFRLLGHSFRVKEDTEYISSIPRYLIEGVLGCMAVINRTIASCKNDWCTFHSHAFFDFFVSTRSYSFRLKIKLIPHNILTDTTSD